MDASSQLLLPTKEGSIHLQEYYFKNVFPKDTHCILGKYYLYPWEIQIEGKG